MTKRGIDIGNYSIKEYPGTNIKSLISTEDNILGSKLTLEYEGKTYYIGEGNFETELNKSKKDNFLPLLLTSIALNSPGNASQEIICGLPINQFKTNKDHLEKMILSDRVREIKLNGETKRIVINKFEVYPEALGAYYSLNVTDDVIIIDIGGRTSDIVYIVNNKPKIFSTVAVGTLNIYKDVADRLNSLYSLDLDIQGAERIIEKGYLEIDGEYTDLNFIKDILKHNFMKINDDLTLKFPIRSEKIIIVGGGNKLFYKAFKNRYINSFVADNPIFANSIGFQRVADMKWY